MNPPRFSKTGYELADSEALLVDMDGLTITMDMENTDLEGNTVPGSIHIRSLWMWVEPTSDGYLNVHLDDPIERARS